MRVEVEDSVTTAVLLHPSDDDASWLQAFAAELPEVDVRLWPDVGDVDSIRFAILSHHSAEDLHRYRNLEAILAMGAGVEQFTTAEMPDVIVVRLHDPEMSDEMAAFALHWIVHFQRSFDVFSDQQQRAQWLQTDRPGAGEFPVGVLGFGTIGQRVGELMSSLGYPVNAWSRSESRTTQTTGTSRFVGDAELELFLGASAVIVNVLPSTADTRHVLNATTFAQCRDGAGLINMGRGATVDEEALVASLDSAKLAFAVLDVTAVEPLPPTSPLWSHPAVRITPHVAGYTLVSTASRIIAENVRRLMAGEAPEPIYNSASGY